MVGASGTAGRVAVIASSRFPQCSPTASARRERVLILAINEIAGRERSQTADLRLCCRL